MVVAEEGRYFFFIKFVPAENTPKNTSHPAYCKLFVNIFHVHGKILEG